jgi:23S rRNA pseudouridine2604 synthase
LDQSISLNKFISDTGYCSRREADNLITEGRVLLNDRPAALGNRYKPGDTVEVDGSLITAAKKEKCVYLALNKPPGITTTTELHIKDNIISFVNYPKRIFPIGRLDKDSEGLIFLTNDGDIINKILRADNNHDKEYVVRVDKAIDTAFVQQMSQGVPILGTRTLPCKVQVTGRQTFRIILTQGLNRQIRRMCEHLGYTVTGLQRVRIMNVKLDKLPLGKWRHLTESEIEIIKESVADSSKVSNETKKKAGKEQYIPKRKGNSRAAEEEGVSKPAKESKTRSYAEYRGKHRSGKPAGRDGAQTSTGKSAAGKTAAGKTAAGRPAPGKPTAGKPASGKSASGRPTSGKPASGKSQTGKPSGRPQPGKSQAGKPGKKANAPQGGRSSKPAGPSKTTARKKRG